MSQGMGSIQESSFIRSLFQCLSIGYTDEALVQMLQLAQRHLRAEHAALWAVDGLLQRVTPVQAIPSIPCMSEHTYTQIAEAVWQGLQGEVDAPIPVGDRLLLVWKLHPFHARSFYAASLMFAQAPPSPQDEELQMWITALSAAARQISLQHQLQQATLQHEKQIKQFTALYEIGLKMQEPELQPLLDDITRKAAEVMEAQACSLMLRSEEEPVLVIRSSYGLPAKIIENTRVAWGKGIAGRVAASGEPMLITDPRHDPRLAGEDVPYREDIEASLCVPLRDQEGQVIGVLNIHRRKPAPVFTEHEMRLFSVFAMQAASAIKNAQLYRDLQRRLQELSVLSELSAVVNSSLHLDRILQQAADGILETVRFDRCAIFLLDPSRRLAIPQAVRGYREETLGKTHIRANEGIIGTVVQTGKQVLVENANQASQPARGFGRMLGASSYLVTPILARERVIGVVVADNRLSGRPIEAANIQLLTTFVNQVGMAIENARLYQDLDRRYNELHNLWEYTRNLLSSIGVGVVSVDREEIVLTWNLSAQRITCLSPQQVLGRRLQEVLDQLYLPDEEKQDILDIVRAPFQTGKRHSSYKHLLHPRGEQRYFNLDSSPLHAPDGTVQGVVLVFEEISRQVQMEVQVKRMERLAAIGQLASTIAHELRNPLSSIRASAQHLRQEYVHLPDLVEFLDIIIGEVDNLNAKATEFLRFARPVEPVLQEVDVAELIHSTVQFMRSYLQEQNVQVKVEADVPYRIYADPSQLKEVLRNLLINSVQAMPEGGTINICAYPLSPEQVQIIVKDTGVGIPSEQLPHIFEPFYTTKAKGTGLGLANVQKIVDSHGGTIEVVSQVGVGTEMRIVLPRIPQHRLGTPESAEASYLRVNVPDV